jgi:uncharacterized membrane protein YfcA
MDLSTFLILMVIGLLAGTVSGFIGVGGGIVVVPMLIFFLGLTQHQAQGTSLALMLPPIGVLAAYNYYKTGNLNVGYAIVIAMFFVLGGYVGSKLSLRLSPSVVKFVFGLLLLYVSARMIWTSSKEIF